MKQPIFVSFEAGLANDSVESPAGQIVTLGGKSVTECIADKLKGGGVIVTAVKQHSFYGWAFTAEYKGVRFFCLVQHLRLWLLTVKPIISIGDRILFKNRTAETQAFADLVVSVMAGDPLFTELVKQSEAEFSAAQRSRAAKS